MKQIIIIIILGFICAGCAGNSETEFARITSPDGHAVATITRKEKTGMWRLGPEPPKVQAKWAKLSVFVGGKQKYDSGFEDIGVYQPCFAFDLAWSPNSDYVAFRSINSLRIVGKDGTVRSFNVIKDNSLVSSFKWISNKELIVISKIISEPLDMYGYPQHYHSYLTKAKNVKILKIDLDSGITERFSTEVKEPTFMFHSVGFMNQEISSVSNRIAFSDGHAICIYDDSVGKIIATAPGTGSIEGTWWETNDKVIVGLGLLSEPTRNFVVLDVSKCTIGDQTSVLLPLWDGTWSSVDWFRSRK